MLEFNKLKAMLEEAEIPFKVKQENSPFWAKNQIIIYDNKGNRLCDVIYIGNGDTGSYGYKKGLLEIMGGLTEEEEIDEVLGYLTAEEVFKRFKYCYENSTSTYKER